jgi:hypothetical protein
MAKNPLLMIESVDDEPEEGTKTDAKKKAAADDLLAAIEEKDSDAVIESITALYRLCALEE